MIKLLSKEFKSIYRQLSKSNIFVKFVVGLFLICIVYFFLNPTSMTHSLRQISNIHYGREGLTSKTLVYYYMEGCPYSKKFDGGWDHFVTNKPSEITTRKVCSNDPNKPEEAAESKKMVSGGFPTVLLLGGGAPIEWKGRKVPQSASEQSAVDLENSKALMKFVK